MGVILQVALPSRVLAAARLQCGAAGAGASRGLGVCAEHARLAARGESARAMEIGHFLGRLGPGGNSQCVEGKGSFQHVVGHQLCQKRPQTCVTLLYIGTRDEPATALPSDCVSS